MTRPSAWSPLRSAVFRALWLGLLASNIGTWMQTVGAQWMLVDVPGAATFVALVQTASMLPILLLAVPAGALADTFDKRRMLLSVQLGLVVVGSLLTALAATGHLPPALLLVLTFGLGVGQALTLPAWQAVIPELVARPELPSASALGAISQNLARAVGPAIAGVLIAKTSVALVFGLNTASFAVFALALWRWRREAAGDGGAPERFTSAVRAGGRFVRHSPVVRRILLRLALFVVPGSALWALLPLVATRRLNLGAGGYGGLLAALGVGAILGAVTLPRIRDRVSSNALAGVAGVAYAGTLVTLALAPWTVLVAVLLVVAGMAWVTVLSNLNAMMQLYLPGWVRARALAVYQVVLAAGLGLGSLAWGGLVEVSNLTVGQLAAAALMLAGVVRGRAWALRDVGDLDRSPAVRPGPELLYDPEPFDGPVLVTIRYEVRAEREAACVAAMEVVSRVRRRPGAVQWGLFKEGEVADHFVEVYLVPSWDEHLRQHSGRLTGFDLELVDRARALAEVPVEVRHLLPARPG